MFGRLTRLVSGSHVRKNILLSASSASAAGLFVAYTQENINAATAVDWEAVRNDLAEIVNEEDVRNPGVDKFPGAEGGGGYVAPMLVRLAWHSAGTYCKNSGTGGSNGCTMRFKDEAGWGANAGLEHARTLMEYVKRRHPGASYADLYVLAGCVAIEEMGGPEIAFTPGRTDAEKEATMQEDPRFAEDGRLPDADKGDLTSSAQHIRDIFYRMGFNDQEIVALSGAHALGHCHTDRSGYWGPWTRAANCFSNEYFRLLLEEDWKIKKRHKNDRWEGPLQYESEDGTLMMLPTDLSLKFDKSFAKYVKMYAADEDLFFADFAQAFKKLCELGCNFN